MTFISVAIPCWEYNGHGTEVLEYSFNKLAIQTFKDFDVVIADHSIDNEIENLCGKWSDKLNIKYIRNDHGRGIVAANLNCAVGNCTGKYIFLLDQDDFAYNQNSLEKIAELINNNDDVLWLATEYVHSINRKDYFNYHVPTLNKYLCITNTIGTCSCVTVKNQVGLPLFDENVTYTHDCDWYYQLWKKYGNPHILNEVTIVNYLWPNSFTSKVTQKLIEKENKYILEKHNIIL